MKHCQHCGLDIIKVDLPGRSLWGHLVDGTLWLDGYGFCFIATPEVSDPTDRMEP